MNSNRNFFISLSPPVSDATARFSFDYNKTKNKIKQSIIEWSTRSGEENFVLKSHMMLKRDLA